MNKIYLFLVLSGLLLSSCSKDQRAIRKIEGEWKISSMKIAYVTKKCGAYEKDSVNLDFNNVGKINFEKEKLEGNYRSGTSYIITPEFKVGNITFKQDTDNTRFTWFVDQIAGTEDQKIGIRDDTTHVYRQCIIEELNKKKLRYRFELKDNCTKRYYYFSLDK